MKRIILSLLLIVLPLQAQSNILKMEKNVDANVWEFTFSGSTAFQLQQLRGTGSVAFYWGDGTRTEYTLTSSDQTVSHTYATTNQYTIRVVNCGRITKLYGSGNAGTWNVNVSKLRNLTSLSWASMVGNFTFNSSYHTGLTFFQAYNLTTGTISITFNSSYHTGLTYFQANNLTTGTISITFNSSYHTGLTYFYAYNLNTGTISITFNSSYHTGLTFFYANNLNTGTISITFNSSYHTGLTFFYANNLNTGTISITYTTHVWSNSVNYIYMNINYGTAMSATDVDQMCIDLDGSAWAGTGKTLRLTGSQIAAPTSASFSARMSLVGKGVSVTTN